MSNKTFEVIYTNVGTEVMDTSGSFLTIAKTYCNNRYFQVLREINWTNIRYDYTFDTAASTQNYAMPDDFSKPLSVRDTTNKIELAETDWQKLVQVYPDSLTDSGTVERYCIVDDTIKAQPSEASAIAVVSSSASDTSQTIRIRGIVSGYEMSELVTLTGTSAANSSNSYTRLLAVSKSDATAGYVSLTSNSGAVTNAVLAPEVLVSRYKLMKLHYVPAGVYTLSVPYYVKPLPMNNDEDYPILNIADLIELGAKADAWRYKKMFNKATYFDRLFVAELERYKWDMANSPNAVQTFSPATYNKDNLY